MKLDKAITIVKEHIEEKLGGNVLTTKNPEIGMVIFVWKKNEKTKFEEGYQQAFAYEDLEKIVDPIIIGKAFVEAYKNPKPEVEEVPKKPSQKKKTEEVAEPAVEETVDLEIKEVIEPTTEELKAEEN